ncbi:MAG: TonB-dependent receptor [Bacteroidia bacterium]|nr:TonB-dependent receptor [Bacteroidia bacterium]
MRHPFLILTFLILMVLSGYSQNNGVIKGFVYDKSNGEAVPFTNVYLKGTVLGANTDINGFFTITRIPPGTYKLLVTSFDYDTIQDPITIKAADVISKKYYAVKGGVKLDEVEVTTTALEKLEKTNVGIQKIDPIVINKLPSVGEPDLAQYLQVIPGVVFTGDQGGQLYIRGGLPVQNKVLLDGLIVYNPFHSIGLFSVFDNETMKNADVYTAGFGAQYGGRTSSIMDITTKDGNKKRHAGRVSFSTFGAKLTLEGPLKKLDEEKGLSASYLFSAKHSYLPQTSPLLYSYANDQGKLPFYYTDIYGKLSINSANGSKFSLFGFNFSDKVNYSDIAQFDWQNTGLGTSFVLVPAYSNLLVEGTFAYSNYNVNFKNPSNESDTKSSSIGGLNTGFNFSKFIGRQELRFGFEGVITNAAFSITNPYLTQVSITRSTMDVGTFFKFKVIDKKKRLVFEPGVRLQYYATLNYFSPEPRASLKFNFTPKIRFKAAAGLYSQTLFSANSDRDVVNLFYGFIIGPDKNNMSKTYLDKDGNVHDANSSVQRANHMVGGFEFDILKYFELNVEVYQKFFNEVININREKVFDDNVPNELRPDVQKKEFIVEQGRAQGFDIALKFEKKRFYFWAVYSYGLNKRWFSNPQTGEILEYAPNFDRRHNVNLVTSYSLGKTKNWEINARFNYGSGFPFTPTQGFLNQINAQGNINYNFNTANGLLGYVPGTINSARLPDFARFDIGVKYKYHISPKTSLETNFGATNVFDRQNIFYVNRFTFARINQLPIMPSLNLSLSF